MIFSAVTPYVDAADTNGDGGERILLPLAFRPADLGGEIVHGAFGTQWTGEVWVENRNLTHVQWGTCEPMVCAPLQPNSKGVLAASPLGGRPEVGQILEVNASDAAHMSFSNRMYERTMRSQPRGIDIPVVREHEFFSSPVTFLGVPSGTGVRLAIRVYDPWAFPPFRPPTRLESIDISIFDEEQRLLGTVNVKPEVVYRDGPGDQARPGFAAITDLAQHFPVVNNHNRLHIRATPRPAGAQFWGMVSVTDNETQTVSIITAQ